ncbi:MAG: haloacid dehalogenase-like hydrolase [Pasteurellaceae bacterium]|nr:haloacid dehalogenase-like hydrolase [Pasteurellaceae bacterium]
MKTLFFDIDGTLHKEDILFNFIVFLYRKHWLKTLLCLPLILLGIILWKLGNNSNLGVNMLYFIACFGLNEKGYRQAVAEFAQHFKATYTPFAQVQAKLNHSDRIFLISGSPVELIQAVYPNLTQQPNVRLIGSISQAKWGSRYISERCYAEHKRVMLDREYPNTQFDEGYSDSLKDLPILALCKQAFRVDKRGDIQPLTTDDKG